MASPTRTPPRVFVDSSVFFAAAYSATGSARDLLIAATDDRVVFVISDYVLTETERNLRENAPRALPAFHLLRETLSMRVRNPSKRLVLDTARLIVAKDAPVVAAARSARVKLVATYDRKDLLSKREAILAAFGITVATPDDVLNLLGLR